MELLHILWLSLLLDLTKQIFAIWVQGVEILGLLQVSSSQPGITSVLEIKHRNLRFEIQIFEFVLEASRAYSISIELFRIYP